jgi:hypothetical protein
VADAHGAATSNVTSLSSFSRKTASSMSPSRSSSLNSSEESLACTSLAFARVMGPVGGKGTAGALGLARCGALGFGVRCGALGFVRAIASVWKTNNMHEMMQCTPKGLE